MANDLFLLAAPIPKLKCYMVLMVPPNISGYNPEFHCNFWSLCLLVEEGLCIEETEGGLWAFPGVIFCLVFLCE